MRDCLHLPPLTAAADNAGGGTVAFEVQAHLLEVQTHVGQNLEQGQLLLRGLVDESGAGRVTLGPLAAIDQMKGAAFEWRFVVLVGLLQALVPALKRT